MAARVVPERLREILPRSVVSALLVALFLCRASLLAAQESPYIVTYDHYLEEPGSLEVEYFSTFGTQRGGNDFDAFWTEFEYGATAWWTAEVYVSGQTTFNDSTIFTGTRLENRFRLLQREHFVNPVLYIEFENTNAADKILKEVEGHDVESDYAVSNAVLRKEHDHELEMKLLLSSTFKGWNVAVNPIVTKNLLPSEPWEFAYAVGASRPLALRASPNRCNFTNLHTTAENFLSANPHFAKSALARYTPADFIRLVEKHRIAYHEKKLGGLFCDRAASDIVAMLEQEGRDAGVEILLDTKIKEVRKNANQNLSLIHI